MTNDGVVKRSGPAVPYSDYQYPICKVLTLGDASVGKTALVDRFVDNRFQPDYKATLGVDFKCKTIRFSATSALRLQIWDTAGQERFQTITKAYYRNAHGVILVFDVNNLKSFRSLGHWLENITEHADPNMEIVLLGNKIDIAQEDRDCRQVSTELAVELAESRGIPYVETSAKTGQNVDDAFMQFAELVYKSRESRRPIDLVSAAGDGRVVQLLKKPMRAERKKRAGCC